MATPADAPVPEASQVDAAWLNAMLAKSGVGPPGARIVAVRSELLSAGKLARTVRFLLTWADADRCGPASLIGKFPADSARVRGSKYAADAYALELAFYRRIAPTIRVSVPRCHFVASDPTTGRFALILHDVGSAGKVGQIAGANADQIAAALVELSRLHVQYWACEQSEYFRWVPVRHSPAHARRLAAAYRLLHRRFLDRFGGYLSNRAVRLIEVLDTVIRRWSFFVNPPYTLLHGDYRVDNLLFEANPADARVTVLDWQNLGIGAGVSDAAYLIGGSLPIEIRRSREAELMRVYLDALTVGGVAVNDRDYRTAYRAHALNGLHMTVVSAMLVDDGPGNRELFVTMAERHAAHADDLDAPGALLTGGQARP